VFSARRDLVFRTRRTPSLCGLKAVGGVLRLADVLDPLPAVLLVLRRRAGLLLACAVLATDAAANGDANSASDTITGSTASRVGQAVITLLALALLAATPRLWPWMWPKTRHRQPNVPRTSQQPVICWRLGSLDSAVTATSSVVGGR